MMIYIDTMITKIKNKNGCWGMPLDMTLSTLADIMRGDDYAHATERLAEEVRQLRQTQDGTERKALKTAGALPYLMFSSRFSRKGIQCFSQLTGLLLLSIETGSDAAKASLLRRQASLLPQTVMVFTGASRRTLKVVVRCQPASGRMPVGEEESLNFLRAARRQATAYYESALHCRIAGCTPRLTEGCRMSHDPLAYYSRRGQALSIIDSGIALHEEYPLAVTDSQGTTASQPTPLDREREQADFYACMKGARQAVDSGSNSGMDAERLVAELALRCRKSAIDMERAVQRTMFFREYDISETAVRGIFQSVYKQTPQGAPGSQMPEKERVARMVHDFFQRRYELRYNTMKGIEEFRPRGLGDEPWMPLTDRHLRRIGQEEMMDCGAAWPIGVEQYARSTFAADYNPVHEFLAGCGTWDRRRNYIRQMARRVPCRYAQWPELFHRWFLGMVAGWMGKSRDFGNAVVPMLIGKQGVRKSTFCKMLLPHSLREYYIDDVKMDNAEQVERILGRMALVNIDEYNAKTEREQAKIKRLLTERDVQVRRMRSDQYVMTQRMASFIATTNERQPLTDPTGSRRYLCVEVTGVIDTDTPVNYQQLYAQAVWEINHGEPYYMSAEEEALMQEHNSQFVSMSATEVLLTSYFQPAPRRKEYFMRAVDILNQLQERTKGADRPNMTRLTRALKASRFEYGAYNGQRGWYAREI